MKQGYATASIVSAEHIVFNIKGNWIKWIGTHKAYDKIDVTKVRYGK